MTNDEIIEFVLYHTEAIKKAIEEKRLDPCLPRTIGHGSKIADITAAAAITNISDVPCVVIGYGPKINGRGNTQVVKKPEMWLRLVKYLDEIYKGNLTEEIIKRRYAMGESQQDTCKALGISRDIYFAYRRDWLRTAELYAVGTGLLPYKRI